MGEFVIVIGFHNDFSTVFCDVFIDAKTDGGA